MFEALPPPGGRRAFGCQDLSQRFVARPDRWRIDQVAGVKEVPSEFREGHKILFVRFPHMQRVSFFDRFQR